MRDRSAQIDWLRYRPIAHRGLCAGGLVENSLPAFQACIANARPIELDVQLTADEEVVVFHDARLDRMTGVAGRVAEMAWPQLRRLRLAGGGEAPPSLAQVLDQVAGAVPILVEIKSQGAPGPLERRTADLVSAYRGEVAVQSFDPASMQAVRTYAPALIRGQLSTDYRRRIDMTAARRAALRNLWLNDLSQPDFIAYDVQALSEARLARLRRRVGERPLVLWTVRERAQADFAARLGCNVIDEPFR